MQTTIVLGLLILVQGCASFRAPQPFKKTISQEKKAKRVTNPVLKAPKSAKRVKTSQAVWHLIFPVYLEFGLHHQETGKKELIRVETTLSDIELPAGHYNIESLVVGSERYDSLEGEELFQFEIKKDSPTYIGSYVVECPKVGPPHFTHLKKMKFFNRVNFTGNTGTCELIVGNDLINVRRAWGKLEKKPPSKLQIGF
jgi:hypothetical protein